MNTEHATSKLERTLNASPQRVFAAWADKHKRAQWDLPGEDWVIAEQEEDFRVGGRQYKRFGPKGDPRFHSEGFFIDIVPDARIVSAGAMHLNGVRSSATLCTVEISAQENGARIILTDQSAYLAGETPAMRRAGWTSILDRLEAHFGA